MEIWQSSFDLPAEHVMRSDCFTPVISAAFIELTRV